MKLELAGVERVDRLPYIPGVPLDHKVRWCQMRDSCLKLSEAVVYEARGETDAGKYSVAWVIMNRVTAKGWRDTVVGVITQRSQFSYLRDMHKQARPSEKDWTTARIVAYDVLNKKVESPVKDSTHYHTTAVKPGWAKRLEVVATLGNHIFYR